MGRSKTRAFSGLWALAMLWLAGVALGAEPLVGSPPVQHFSPDIEVHPQNYAVAQDPQGIVYVGNQEGVLEFDGENWRLLHLPNHEIVRSLAVSPGGRVYVGGYNSFGYLERRPGGELSYHDLTSRFAQQIGGHEFAD